MIRCTALFVCATLFLSSSTALAQEITPVREGERAPFSGQLFPESTAIRWKLRLESLEDQLRLEVERAERTCEIRVDLLTAQLRLLEERRLDETTFLREETRKARDRSWWEHPALWTVIGAVVVGIPHVIQQFR